MLCALGLEWALFPKGLDAAGTRKKVHGEYCPASLFTDKLMGGEEGVVLGPDQPFSDNVKEHAEQMWEVLSRITRAHLNVAQVKLHSTRYI